MSVLVRFGSSFTNPVTHMYLAMTGPAELVQVLWFWPDQFFHQGKSKIPFLQKVSDKQSVSVILELIMLIMISYNR